MTKKISLALALVAVSVGPAWAASKNKPGNFPNRMASKPMGLKAHSGSNVSTRAYGKPEWILVGNTVISDHREGVLTTSPSFANLAANGPPPAAHAIGTPPSQPMTTTSGRPFSRPDRHASPPNGGVTVTIRPNPQRVNNVVGGW